VLKYISCPGKELWNDFIVEIEETSPIKDRLSGPTGVR